MSAFISYLIGLRNKVRHLQEKSADEAYWLVDLSIMSNLSIRSCFKCCLLQKSLCYAILVGNHSVYQTARIWDEPSRMDTLSVPIHVLSLMGGGGGGGGGGGFSQFGLDTEL